MKKRFFHQITITIMFISMSSIGALAQTANGISIQRDIVYGHAGGVDLKCNMARPAKGEGPFPAILFFHGGGWQAGNKSDGNHWIRMFADSGYVGVTVEYRFAPAFKWPAQVEDAKAAIRYLRANAVALNIDSNRIGVMGESAGAYLALMAGVTDGADGLEGDGGSAGYSSGVQAVVSYFGSSDFTLPKAKLSPEVEAAVMKYYNKPLNEVIADFMGTTDPGEPLLKKMSVVTYVNKNDPPTLIFQGDADPFVSVQQAQKLSNVFEQANVPHELIIVKGGGHGWTGKLQDETNIKMFAFLKKIFSQRE